MESYKTTMESYKTTNEEVDELMKKWLKGETMRVVDLPHVHNRLIKQIIKHLRLEIKADK